MNVSGMFMMTTLSVDMLRNKGNAPIVNITSNVILKSSPGAQLYAISNGSVYVFTKGISLTMAHGIRVNSICSRVVETAFFRR